MRKQHQHTTIAVVLLLVVLGGALYLVETTTGMDGNRLTAATVGAQAIDCNEPLAKDVSSFEKQEYYDQCKNA